MPIIEISMPGAGRRPEKSASVNQSPWRTFYKGLRTRVPAQPSNECRFMRERLFRKTFLRILQWQTEDFPRHFQEMVGHDGNLLGD